MPNEVQPWMIKAVQMILRKAEVEDFPNPYAQIIADCCPAQGEGWNGDWINEDELPVGYPYHWMFAFSKLGQDGKGGVRMFPNLPAPPAQEEK